MVEAGSFKGNPGEVPFDSKPRVQPPVGSCPKALVPGQTQLGQSSPLQALSLGERPLPGCCWKKASLPTFWIVPSQNQGSFYGPALTVYNSKCNTERNSSRARKCSLWGLHCARLGYLGQVMHPFRVCIY